jgi:stage II sporulation protein R
MNKNTAKAILFFCLALLFLLVLSPIAGAENLYGSVIRLHVLAASDSPEDQEVKLYVRDRILEYTKKNLSLGSTRDQAAMILEEKKDTIRAIAEDALREKGSEETVEVVLKQEYYPTRVYSSLSLPAGTYLSLQVKIGKAQGKNWWCVLFPPMCLNSALGAEDALLESGMERENTHIVTRQEKRYRIRFKILEFWGEGKEKLRRFF